MKRHFGFGIREIRLRSEAPSRVLAHQDVVPALTALYSAARGLCESRPDLGSPPII